jgi:hypothetical protein
MSLAHHSNLSHLSDDELIRHVDNGLDKLTSTEIEIELLARFENHSDTLRDLSPVLEVLNNYETTAKEIAEDVEFLASVTSWETGEQMTIAEIAKEIEFAKEVRNLLQQHGHATPQDLEASLGALASICEAIKPTKFSTPNT